MLAIALTIAAALDSAVFIRVNQVGYLPDAPKVAVACMLEPREISSFTVVRVSDGKRVFGPARPLETGAFGPCKQTYRMNFTALKAAGSYTVVAGPSASPVIRIGDDVYRGAADTLLATCASSARAAIRCSAIPRTPRTGLLVDHPTRTGEFIPVSGGWARRRRLPPVRRHIGLAPRPAARHTAITVAHSPIASMRDGLPGATAVAGCAGRSALGSGVAAAHVPGRQPACSTSWRDDRDHQFWDLPANDSSDYGWGKGGSARCIRARARRKGLFQHKNRADGLASTAGKYAAAFALGAALLRGTRPGIGAIGCATGPWPRSTLGERDPGVCQTAPGRSPYFYEEDNWVDDMELGAAELYALTGAERYRATQLNATQS